MRNDRPPLAILLAAVCFVLGCGVESDSHGGADAGMALDPDLTIGLLEGDPAYLFGAIMSVTASESGTIYVGDRIGATIRAFDSAGAIIKEVAKEGGGPGEISGWPADILTQAESKLYVRDGSRITVFTQRRGASLADSVEVVWRLPGYGNMSSTRSRVGADGTYYYPGYRTRDEQTPRYFYIPFRNGAPTGDTLEVPPHPALAGRRTAWYRTGPGGGRMLDGLSYAPFAAPPVWDVTHAGTILSSAGDHRFLAETNVAGDTLRTIAVPGGDRRPVPLAERQDSLRALEARLDSVPVSLDEVIGLADDVRERRLPELLPAVIGIHIGADSAIWVERWPDEGHGQSRFYDILEHDGTLRARVELRAPMTRDPPPFFMRHRVIGVVRDPETGVERVVRFTLPRE